MPEPADWMSAPQAAELLGLELHTVHKLIAKGELRADIVELRSGSTSRRRVYRLSRADVDACVDAARIRPGSLRHLYGP